MFATSAALSALHASKIYQLACSVLLASTTSQLPFLAHFTVATISCDQTRAQVGIMSALKLVLRVTSPIVQPNTVKVVPHPVKPA